MFLRLCSRAPRTTNESPGIDSELRWGTAFRSTLGKGRQWAATGGNANHCRPLPPIAAVVQISYVSIPHDPRRAGAHMNRGGPPAPQGQGPKRERRWQTSQERARVAAELIEEAETLTQTGAIASPNDVARDQQPPPIRVAPLATPAPQAKLDQEPSPAPSEE